MTCAIVLCPTSRYTNGEPHPFCTAHQQEFEGAPEGINRRPTSRSDFRDRLWKEECARKADEKWKSATLEQREEWKKGGWGR